MMKFDVDSSAIANMDDKLFQREFVLKKKAFIHTVGKHLHSTRDHIDRLIPLQNNKGVTYTIIIDTHSMHFNYISQSMRECIRNRTFAQDFAKINKITMDGCDISQDSLSIFKVIHKQTVNATNGSVMEFVAMVDGHMKNSGDNTKTPRLDDTAKSVESVLSKSLTTGGENESDFQE